MATPSNQQSTRIVIVGTGNSGTRLLGRLLHDLLHDAGRGAPYLYEPLYWRGNPLVEKLTLDPAAVAEHVRFPLYPDESVAIWPWMERFLEQPAYLAKFIRAGSRIRLFHHRIPRLIWITRELHGYLASMQKNFPRCAPDAGWHHRPGAYDDFARLQQIYPEYLTSAEEEERVVAEAAWWHVQNRGFPRLLTHAHVHFIRYEDLCLHPRNTLHALADFLGLDRAKIDGALTGSITAPKEYPLRLTADQRDRIEKLAGALNRELFA